MTSGDRKGTFGDGQKFGGDRTSEGDVLHDVIQRLDIGHWALGIGADEFSPYFKEISTRYNTPCRGNKSAIA